MRLTLPFTVELNDDQVAHLKQQLGVQVEPIPHTVVGDPEAGGKAAEPAGEAQPESGGTAGESTEVVGAASVPAATADVEKPAAEHNVVI